jgi:hypothetical protein
MFSIAQTNLLVKYFFEENVNFLRFRVLGLTNEPKCGIIAVVRDWVPNHREPVARNIDKEA